MNNECLKQMINGLRLERYSLKTQLFSMRTKCPKSTEIPVIKERIAKLTDYLAAYGY